MDKCCWTCGHWLIGLGCTKDSVNNYTPTNHDYVCGDWVTEGTKGTITEFQGWDESDGSSWEENEYLKDDESNL